MNDEPERAGMPAVVGRAAFQAELDRLRVREKAHTREGDAIAAGRRRLPMVEPSGRGSKPGALTTSAPPAAEQIDQAARGRPRSTTDVDASPLARRRIAVQDEAREL